MGSWTQDNLKKHSDTSATSNQVPHPDVRSAIRRQRKNRWAFMPKLTDVTLPTLAALATTTLQSVTFCLTCGKEQNEQWLSIGGNPETKNISKPARASLCHPPACSSAALTLGLFAYTHKHLLPFYTHRLEKAHNVHIYTHTHAQ